MVVVVGARRERLLSVVEFAQNIPGTTIKCIALPGVLLACGRRNVFVDNLSAEEECLLRPGSFGVKVVVRSHYLSSPAPMCTVPCIDLSEWNHLSAVDVNAGAVAVDIGQPRVDIDGLVMAQL